jgi:hypothetical protein
LGHSALFSGLAGEPGLFNHALAAPNPFVPPAQSFMILVAIFSIIVLLLCFLCYSGDCNN